jgi:hypothetical protein
VRVNRIDAIGDKVLSRTDPCLALSYRAIEKTLITLIDERQVIITLIVNKSFAVFRLHIS